MYGGFAVALVLLLAIGIYLLLMFGLTFWFERYHYYKDRFYSTATLKGEEPLSDVVGEQTDNIPEIRKASHGQSGKSEVDTEG